MLPCNGMQIDRMDCKIIVHELTVILIFTELDSRKCKPFSKASQGNQSQKQRDGSKIHFISCDQPRRSHGQINGYDWKHVATIGVGVGNILLSQLRSNSKRYSKSRTIFFWRNLGLNTVRYA